MGLPTPVIEIIMAEHSYRAISGDVAFIGRQSTFATAKSLRHFEQKYKIRQPTNFQIEIDRQTHSALGDQYKRRILKWGPMPAPADLITDQCLMNFLGVKSFSAIDISDYEGAEIICDLSLPLPESLYERFDFIFNGSCLDNIFNPAEAIRNLSRMLRPNGRLMMMEHGTMMNGPYTIFSPGWFFDFFCYNRYADCKVYHGLFKDVTDLHYGPWPLFLFNLRINKHGVPPQIRSRNHIMYLVIAEKGPHSSNDVLPVQAQYRDAEFEKMIFTPQATSMREFNRPIFGMEKTQLYQCIYPFLDCGYLGKGVPV